MYEVYRYQTEAGAEPVSEWFATVTDKLTQAVLRRRITRLQLGSLGDVATVGSGVFELREHTGAGYRIYFARHGSLVIILLCGGTKRTQAADIKKAIGYWTDWKRRQL